MAPYSLGLISEMSNSMKKARSLELRVLSWTQLRLSHAQLPQVEQNFSLKNL